MEWITTSDVSAETWRRLLEFANTDVTVELLERYHGSANSRQLRSNYKKQAQQIRVCLLQAREYLDAARSSSIYTSPNHLYYGMVSLASAVMLVNGDGRKSLDYLRGAAANNHHGLKFSTGVTSVSCHRGLTILENSFVEILNHGHFINWYQTLPSRDRDYATIKKLDRNGTTNTKLDVAGCVNMQSATDIAGIKRSILSCMLHLPDLFRPLSQYRVLENVSRSDYDINIQPDPRNRSRDVYKHTWRYHGTSTGAALEAVLDQFSVSPSYATLLTCIIGSNGRSAIVVLEENTEEMKYEGLISGFRIRDTI